jgi:hypothetical protein
VQRTRTVTKTRWTSVSGNVQHFFDDVLICGSKSLSDREVGYLCPWDLKNLEQFRPDFLSGFKTERYAVGLEEGFVKARQIMDGQIRQLCRRDIGGDHQELSTVQTQHVGVTFKHLLLPVWVGAYRYQNQPYRVLVNARTGKVFGSRPYSWAKIVLLIAVILLIIATIIGIIALAGGLSSARHGARPTTSSQQAQLAPHPAESIAIVALAPGFSPSSLGLTQIFTGQPDPVSAIPTSCCRGRSVQAEQRPKRGRIGAEVEQMDAAVAK